MKEFFYSVKIATVEINFRVGDKIKVVTRVKEGDKTRLQNFEGIVISLRGKPENKFFTVRKIAQDAVGVERIWPVNSPGIEKIDVVKKGNVRRAKLYYLRKRIGKEAVLV